MTDKMIKFIILFIFGAFLFVHPAQAGLYAEFNDRLGHSGYSPTVHVVGGAVISGLVTYYLPEDMSPELKWVIGFGASVLAGCVSEGLDKNWDQTDLIQWGAGGFIGATFLTVKF